jgi:hypothetical protein
MKLHGPADDSGRVVVLDNLSTRFDLACRRLFASSALHLFLGCGQIALFNGDTILHAPAAEK